MKSHHHCNEPGLAGSTSFFAATRWVGLTTALLLGGQAQAQAPAWQMATELGGNLSTVTALAATASGDVYVAGNYYGGMTLGSIGLPSAPVSIFVAKWNATNGFIWAQSVTVSQNTGGNNINAVAIAVNGASVYVAGTCGGRTASFGSIGTTNAGGPSNDTPNAYVAKLTDAGASSTFAWVQRVGGSLSDGFTALAVQGADVFVAGNFNSPAAVLGSVTLTGTGGPGMVAKITDLGSSSSFGWALKVGTTAKAVAVVGTSVYVAGQLSGVSSAFGNPVISAGGNDALIAKLTDAGTSASYVWAQRAGGTGNDAATALAVNAAQIYVAGFFSNATADFGSTTLASAGGADAFVAKLTDAGPNASFAWAQQAGGSAAESVSALALQGPTLFVTGDFTSPTANFGSTALTSAGQADVFVAALADAGATSRFAWAQRAGGAGAETSAALAIGSNSLYVGGGAGPLASFGSTTFSNASQHGFLAVLPAASGLAAGRESSLSKSDLFPNPAHGRATIQLPAIPGATSATLTILDVLGRAIRSQTAPTNAQTDLDLIDLAPGLYAVRVQASGSSATRRLVVE